MEKFYMVHVFYTRLDGFSIPVKTLSPMDDEEVITYALDHYLLESEDANHVDYVEEINEETYKSLGGK